MAKCKRKMCRSRCRDKRGRFKKCRRCDKRYPIKLRCGRRKKRRRRRRASCPRKKGGRGFMVRCRSRSGKFKRCAQCDRKYRVRKRGKSKCK